MADEEHERIVEIAFSESVRKLSEVSRTVESMRARAVGLLTAATAIGAFVGGLAINASPSGTGAIVVGVLGAGTYVLSVLLAIRTITPKHKFWATGQNTRDLVSKTRNTTAYAVKSRLAELYQDAFDDTNEKLDDMGKDLTWAARLVVAELLFFLCLLGLTTTQKDPAATLLTTTTTSTSTTQPPASQPAPSSSTTPPAVPVDPPAGSVSTP